MKRFKVRKLALMAAACSMSLLFVAPSSVMPVSAATPSDSETVSPQADVITWVYERKAMRSGSVYITPPPMSGLANGSM